MKHHNLLWTGIGLVLVLFLSPGTGVDGFAAPVRAAPASPTYLYAFTGHVYEGEPYNMRLPKAGVTVGLWGDADEWPESGTRTLLATTTTDENGYFFFTPESIGRYPYLHIIEEDPTDYHSTGAQVSQPGWVKNYNCVSYLVDDLQTGGTYDEIGFWDAKDAPPDLVVSKTLLSPVGGVATYNDIVSFRITVENTSGAGIAGFNLEDYFSAEAFEFVSATRTPTEILDYGTDRAILWESLSLDRDDTLTIDVNFRAIDPGTTVQNCAYYVLPASGGDIVGILGPSSCVSVQVDPLEGKHFTIYKHLITPLNHIAAVGDWVSFETECRITGDESATAVRLYDYLQPPSAGPTPFFPLSFTWNWPFSTGDWAKNMTAFKTLGPALPATNTAEWTVTWADGTQKTQVAQDYVYITDGSAGTGLYLDKRLMDPIGGAGVGDTLTFRVTITNVTQSILATVPLTDTFPSACFSLQSASVVPDHVTGGRLNWDNIGPLASGAVRTVNVLLKADAVCPTAMNCATASAAQPGGAPLVGADCEQVAVDGPQPQLIVKKTRITPNPAIVNDLVEWEIALSNAGTADLPVVPLHDSYPPSYFDYIGASKVPDGVDPTTGEVDWTNLGPLGSGEAMSMVLSLKAKKPGFNIQNCADSTYTVGASTFQPFDCDNVDIQAGEPAIEVEKVRVEPLPEKPLAVGNTTVFSLTVRNVGNAALSNLLIADAYDPGCLTYINAPGMNTQVVAPGQLTWDIPALDIGDRLAWEVEFRADGVCAAAPNCVVGDAEGPGGQHVGHEQCIEFPIEPHEPAVKLNKIVVEPAGQPATGDVVHYGVIVENSGNSTLASVPVRDQFDADCLSYVSASPAPDVVSPTIGLLRWHDLAPLNPGDARVLQVFLRVKNPCRPTLNCANTTSEDVNALSVTAHACVDVFSPTQEHVYLPLVIRNSS